MYEKLIESSVWFFCHVHEEKSKHNIAKENMFLRFWDTDASNSEEKIRGMFLYAIYHIWL